MTENAQMENLKKELAEILMTLNHESLLALQEYISATFAPCPRSYE